MTERPSILRDDWLAQVDEPVIDPDREIVDPHHHLWHNPAIGDYLLDHLHADTGSGHRVVQTVFVECHADYRDAGPEHLRPVGETEFVAGVAAQSEDSDGAVVAGIVSHADLRLDPGMLGEVLDAHDAASGGRFRGIRHAGSRALEADLPYLLIAGRGDEGLYADPDFRRGVRLLGQRGLTYDTWHYHHQNADFLDLARAVPDTTLVLDHFGTPLGVGQWDGKHDEIFETWTDDIAAIAGCPNVVAKLGGLAMPDNGFGWHLADHPPTSDEFVAAQARWYHHTIEQFGPERCMFESNFPVDRWSLGYRVLWNGLKKIAAPYSEAEQQSLFASTARSVYRLPTDGV